MTTDELTVADLTEEHVGWYMQVDVEPQPGVFLPPHRCIELGAVRRWEYPAGTLRIGLLDVSTKRPGIAGDERQFLPEARVKLLRQLRKPRKLRKPQQGSKP